jgi:hypothetical protein
VKTMTCRQMGGPCGAQFRGSSADDVIKDQDAHLKSAVAGGDRGHDDALKAMQGRWKNPIKGMRWYMRTKKDFAALTRQRPSRSCCIDRWQSRVFRVPPTLGASSGAARGPHHLRGPDDAEVALVEGHHVQRPHAGDQRNEQVIGAAEPLFTRWRRRCTIC